jgi:hypothetical protein
MAAAASARDAKANSANSANRSLPEAIGTIGTIGTKELASRTAEARDLSILSALSALSAQSEDSPPAVALEVPPCPARIFERSALIEDGDDCLRAEADRRALAEFGLASWRELANAHAAVIRFALDGLPAIKSVDGRRLLAVTLAFLASTHWPQAVASGWPLVELFGVDPHAPAVRDEGWGAVTALAWSHKRPLGIERVTCNEIIIACRSSATKRVHRLGDASQCGSVLWWECAALIGEHAA